MNGTSVRDLVVGVFVLAGLAAIAYLSITIGGMSYAGPGGLQVYASFDQTGGLKPRAPVVIAGVKVGQVSSVRLDEDYRARVELDLDPGLELPLDTSASIVTAGLLGDRYISLQIGGDPEILRSGDEITFTESALILERVIGQFIYGQQNGGTQEESGPTGDGGDDAAAGAGEVE